SINPISLETLFLLNMTNSKRNTILKITLSKNTLIIQKNIQDLYRIYTRITQVLYKFIQCVKVV
ncbi:unnamed protein product, partial [marine sediment metagenome]